MKKFLIFAMVSGLFSLVAIAQETTFKVRIENVSTDNILKSSTGATAPAGLSPGLAIVYKGNSNPLFVPGHPDHGKGLERLAEDGNPAALADSLPKEKGVVSVKVFNTPEGKTDPGPIGPGGAYEVTFNAPKGTKLMLAQMFGQSNDLFYAPAKGIDLFDKNGNPISGDFTSGIELWDAGTEVNQEPGFGPDQAPRQSAPNTGASEHDPVGHVKDKFTYPTVNQVLKVTISAQ